MGCGTSQTKDKQTKGGKSVIVFPIMNEAMMTSDHKFRDMEETKSGIYLGEGIKRIPNYKCSLPYDKLEDLREQFWVSQNPADPIWPLLKECCNLDAEQAQGLILLFNQILLNNSLRDSYQKSRPNFVYHIPNFCICDPYIEKYMKNFERMYDDFDEVNLSINVYYYENKKTYTFKLRNKCTGFDLKHKFAQLINLDKRNYKLRVFYKGQEILDSHCLYFYEIQNDSLIQAIAISKADFVSKKMSQRMHQNTLKE